MKFVRKTSRMENETLPGTKWRKNANYKQRLVYNCTSSPSNYIYPNQTPHISIGKIQYLVSPIWMFWYLPSASRHRALQQNLSLQYQLLQLKGTHPRHWMQTRSLWFILKLKKWTHYSGYPALYIVVNLTCIHIRLYVSLS